MRSIGEAPKAAPSGTPDIKPILSDLFTLNDSTHTTECGIMVTEWSFVFRTLKTAALVGILLARLRLNPEFTYGYGRVEDVLCIISGDDGTVQES